MPKLSVREQRALTETIVNQVSDLHLATGQKDWDKNHKDKYNKLLADYKKWKDYQEDCGKHLANLEKQLGHIRKEFKESQKMAIYNVSSHDSDYRYSSPLDEDYKIRISNYKSPHHEIMREVTIAQLKSDNDIQELIKNLVLEHAPKRPVKELLKAS